MKPTQQQIAEIINVSSGHLSDILSGKKPIGKRTALKVSEIVNIPWNVLLVMPADDLKKSLISNLTLSNETSGQEAG